MAPSFLEAIQEGSDVAGAGPIRFVDDRATPGDHPTHVREQPIGMMGRSVQVVDQDRAADPDLVAEPPGGGELGSEVSVRPDDLPGVRLSGVDEEPSQV